MAVVTAARRPAASSLGFLPVAAAFALMVILVSPMGEFPLNDDWIYNASVSQRLETGDDLIDRATSAYLYPQRYYGTALARAFGYSISMLRISGLLASILSLFLAYRLLVRLGFSTFACFAGTAILLANPIFINLSYSFMTDLPYLVFFLGAILFYLRAAQRRSRADLVAGTIFTLLATAQRQTGVLLCPAALAYFLALRRSLRPRPVDWLLLLLPAAGFAALTALRHAGPATELSLAMLLDPREWARLYLLRPLSDQPGMTPDRMLDFYRMVLVALPASLGLFLAPILLGALLPRPWSAVRKVPRGFLLAAALSLGALLALRAGITDTAVGKLQVGTMPFLTNILNRCGVGPGAGEVLVGECDPVLPPAAWNTLTALSLVAAAVLLGLFCRWAGRRLRALRWRSLSYEAPAGGGGDGAPAGAGLVVLAGLGQIVPFFVVYPLDRYLIPLLLPSAVILLDAFRGTRLARGLVIAGLLAFFLYGLAGVRDYLAWNRVRWEMARSLVAQGVPENRVDAGLEWAGYRLYFENPSGARGPTPPGLLWYVYHVPNLDPEFLISFSEILGYRPLEVRTVDTWLPGPGPRLVLSRRVRR